MYRRSDVLAKLREKAIVDLGDAELDRAFEDVVNPDACKRAVARMIADDLTIEEVYQQSVGAA